MNEKVLFFLLEYDKLYKTDPGAVLMEVNLFFFIANYLWLNITGYHSFVECSVHAQTFQIYPRPEWYVYKAYVMVLVTQTVPPHPYHHSAKFIIIKLKEFSKNSLCCHFTFVIFNFLPNERLLLYIPNNPFNFSAHLHLSLLQRFRSHS